MNDFFSTENLNNVHQNNPDSLLFAHLAARYIEENEFQKAIDLCQKGLNKHPNYAFGHFILGLAHYHIKNYTDAKKELEIALAYDPTSPKAWEVLSTINEILNLSDDATESNLNSYLIDYFNKDASPNFLPAEETPIPEIQDYVKPSEIHESDKTEKLPSEVSEEEIDNIVKNAMSGDNTEFDFEKTLNEVFNEYDTEDKIEGVSEEKEGPEQTKESEESLTEQKSEESKDLEKESMVTADEFSSALESFFSKYEEKDDSNKPAEVELEESPSEPEETTPTNISSEDTTMPDEENTDSTIEVAPEKKKYEEETQEEVKKFPSGTDITFDEQQEDLIDFSSVVSDIIKESDEPAIQEREVTEEEAELSPGDYPTGSEKNIDIPTETDFNSPEMMPDEDQVESDQSSMIDLDLSQSEETESRKKPPILSPTLGEIYIAQGRFEEAIDVFKALLKKEPQNTRYKRKLEDVKKILTKKKSGS